MSAEVADREVHQREPWYKYGIAFLVLEALIATGVSIYSLSMGFTGHTVQFKKKVTFDKPAIVETVKPEQCIALEKQYLACLKDAGITPKQ